MSSEPASTWKCSKCQVAKPVTEFWPHKKGGYQAYCKPCKYEKQREWRKTAAGRAAQARRSTSGQNRRDHLMRRYKIDEVEYQRMHIAAGGTCEICSAKPEYRLYVDHCHGTDEIRGLLCRPCNAMLGFAKDDITVLERAIQYLKLKTS